MKAKYAFVGFFVGLLIGLIGAIFKIEHWVGSDLLLLTGLTLQLGSGVGFFYKLLTQPGSKGFFNR